MNGLVQVEGWPWVRSLEVQVGQASVESENNDVTQLINRQLIDAACSPPPSSGINNPKLASNVELAIP